jgi:hypothetical protein
MAAAARSIIPFNAIKMGFKVIEDQRMDNNNIMNIRMKKRLILLILFDSAWSIFSSIPKEMIRCRNWGNMGILKWLSLTKKEKIEQT